MTKKNEKRNAGRLYSDSANRDISSEFSIFIYNKSIVKGETKMKLGNKSYSHKRATYNAMWLYSDGSPAYWGNYNPYDGSFYLATPGGVLASGMWIEQWNGDNVFQVQGCYNYDDVRRAIQLGVF